MTWAAIRSSCGECWLSQRLNESATTPDTKETHSRKVSLSLVWPVNCGSCNFTYRTEFKRSQTSPGAILMPRRKGCRKIRKIRAMPRSGRRASHLRRHPLGGGHEVDMALFVIGVPASKLHATAQSALSRHLLMDPVKGNAGYTRSCLSRYWFKPFSKHQVSVSPLVSSTNRMVNPGHNTVLARNKRRRRERGKQVLSK